MWLDAARKYKFNVFAKEIIITNKKPKREFKLRCLWKPKRNFVKSISIIVVLSKICLFLSFHKSNPTWRKIMVEPKKKNNDFV